MRSERPLLNLCFYSAMAAQECANWLRIRSVARYRELRQRAPQSL